MATRICLVETLGGIRAMSIHIFPFIIEVKRVVEQDYKLIMFSWFRVNILYRALVRTPSAVYVDRALLATDNVAVTTPAH